MSERNAKINRPDREALLEFLAQVPIETMALVCWWLHGRYPADGYDAYARQFEALAEVKR